MAGIDQARATRRFATLGGLVAAVALVVQLAVPPGFMVSAIAGGPAIVICTGSGPLFVHPEHRGQPGKTPNSKSNAICAFAGHGATPVAPSTQSFAREVFETFVPASGMGVDLAPGRGLAAPPPPSQGPPTLSL
jgi:hypothetical protein